MFFLYYIVKKNDKYYENEDVEEICYFIEFIENNFSDLQEMLELEI